MPPHEIPVEASDTLAFIPSSLAEIEKPPVFTLRAITERDRRFFRRMQTEEGVDAHSDKAIRDATRSELKRLWSPEDFEVGIARLEAYWHAVDDWALQRKDDPDLKFEFDPAEREDIDELSDRLAQASPVLRRMQADNEDAAYMRPLIFVATAVERFDNLDVKLQRAGGYLSLECAVAIRKELRALGEANKLDLADLPFLELMGACAKRFRIGEDAEKNSASPSLSGSDPQNSSGKDGTSGKSHAATAKSSKSRAKTSKQ